MGARGPTCRLVVLELESLMYCSGCGNQVAEGVTYCTGCGKAMQPVQVASPPPAKGSGCLLVGGLVLATFGVLISFTVVGVIIGVPMAIIGGALAGWHFIRMANR